MNISATKLLLVDVSNTNSLYVPYDIVHYYELHLYSNNIRNLGAYLRKSLVVNIFQNCRILPYLPEWQSPPHWTDPGPDLVTEYLAAVQCSGTYPIWGVY